ncbi:MAG: sigma-54-dependent Fis family transcriptional regulator [Candidatus Omnitrophica bacterium]|nr:sigma-54-dependent Fis family transcriptional regulator [Candidatus Omnitrophota bacterium]MCA9435278.1 sigma-54-dependent Fis family transcriptional regulator [Candidatus Omnitrophota bacterium]MCA9440432.1 sigma-54-dependent Fis family transcriptional regulator [Candidatus Omnitrophota bacterium]MCB9783962.1 sigma-54-dependent Fis family transcriptional regulator [Candidatus Omnitrophota bacterium]
MKRPRQILVVDDEANIRKFLKKSLERDGYEVRLAGTGEEALTSLEDERPDLLVLDVWLPDANGMDLLSDIRRTDPDLPIIIITAFGEIKMAVEAMRAGAFDFVAKPFDFNTLNRSIENALKISTMRDELNVLKSVWERGQYRGLIGQSSVMQELFRKIERIGASSTTTVLITGETGSGKEVVARAIHQNSERKEASFVAVNCATLDDHLLESELFGHVRGAFTDAKTNKLGLFEVADGGTLFLDEIGEMELRLQAKLLRVLEDKTFRRVGGTRDINVDVRVVAATNVSLEKSVSEGRFREDLFYRLSVIPLRVPPLRVRGQDVILLAESFLTQYNHEFSRNIAGFTDDAKQSLMDYDWPGNVRELRNAIERMVLLQDGDIINANSLPVAIGKRKSPILKSTQASPLLPFKSAKDRIVKNFEKEYLENLLRTCEGNVTRAAETAEMERSSLQRLLRKHSLNSRDFKKVSNLA